MTRPSPPKRPYLLRAMHQWISDCANTPHVIVDAERAGPNIPKAYVKEGKIVLNLSFTATQRLVLGDEDITFDARFAGVVHHVSFPVAAVLGVYGAGAAAANFDGRGRGQQCAPYEAATQGGEVGAGSARLHARTPHVGSWLISRVLSRVIIPLGLTSP
jgi:stringent starvation protein B